MSYCDGLCPDLDERTHKCRLTGEKLAVLKGWWGTTHEHGGFCERDENKERVENLEGRDELEGNSSISCTGIRI